MWVRPEVNKERKGQYKHLPIEEKESHQWLRAAAESKQNLSAAQMITVIGDREADVDEELAGVPNERTHLVTKSGARVR